MNLSFCWKLSNVEFHHVSMIMEQKHWKTWRRNFTPHLIHVSATIIKWCCGCLYCIQIRGWNILVLVLSINYWWWEILNCSWTALMSKLQLSLRIETQQIWDIFLLMCRHVNFPLQQYLGHLELWNSKCGQNTNEGLSYAFQNENCCLTCEWIVD